MATNARGRRGKAMTEKLILAHDLGTSGNKATLFSENGTLIANSTHPYPTDYRSGGVAEQDPEDWYRAVCISTRKLLADRDVGRVAAIAFSGMMQGCLCMSGDGRPLRKHMLYCDQRATEQSARFGEKAGLDAIYRISGNRVNAANSAAKYMWVKEHEPEIYGKTHKILNAKDYLNYRLTGRMATDPTDASGTNLYDLVAWDWSQELIDASGLDRDKFPDIVPSTAVLGELTREAAEDLGLRPGIPVMTGAADGLCAGVGAGSVAPGVTYNCLGTSAWVATTTTEPLYDPRQRSLTFAHAVPGLFQPMGTMLVGGAMYSWLKGMICRDVDERAATLRESPYDLLNEEAASSPAGANGLIFLPHLMGERAPRWNSFARAGFIGLNMMHKRADMIRAVLEGVAMNLTFTIDIFRDLGVPIGEVTMIGGGARGMLWRQIMADAYDADILLSNYLDEATSIGAAILAGIGSGIFKDFSVVDRFIKKTDRVPPIAGNVRVYREKKLLFDDVYNALEPLFPRFPEC